MHSKILLLGKSGMLGSCFEKHLQDLKYEVFAFDREELDVTDIGSLHTAFAKIKPGFVINCAAYTAVDDAEGHRNEAFKVNAEAVGHVSKLSKEFGATLIHFSTDYVFNGKKSDGYDEKDEPEPINIYGESKLAGERLIAANMEKFYIIRTSWLFGSNGKNFVDTMLKLGAEKPELKVVNDQIGSPTYTEDLCQSVIEIFLQNDFRDFGIYHLTNSDTCSWYDFAKKIFEIKKMPAVVIPVSSSEFPRPAKRPKFSILRNTKTSALRSWQEALMAYLEGV